MKPISTISEGIRDYFKPDPDYLDAAKGQVINYKLLARLVGYISIGLPCAMLAGVLVFGICHFQSMSHFYFAPFVGDLFVLGIAMIGTFMIAYRGESPRENMFVSAAGICAFLIALFPTSLRGCEVSGFRARLFANVEVSSPDSVAQIPATDAIGSPWPIGHYFELFPYSATIHATAAGIFFVFLALYVLLIFTRVIDGEHRNSNGELTVVKQRRNGVYKLCGGVILFCVGAIGLFNLFEWLGVKIPLWNQLKLTFFVEMLMLCAFGYAWMVKGRFWGNRYADPRDKYNH